MRRLFILFLLLSVFTVPQLHAKTRNFGTWIELEFKKKLIKDLEVSFVPEFRFDDNFLMDEYMFEGALAYEPLKFLELSAAYRLGIDVKKGPDEMSHRFAFDATGKKKFDRTEISLRTRFTNYLELEEGNDFGIDFRPRLKMEYNIKGNKITPFISYELFRNLSANEFDKGRFDVGVTRELGKIHRVGIYYRLQDYFSDRNSLNILGIEYRLKI